MFADDTNLSCNGQSSADIEYKLNCDLDNIQKWLISNKLTLNLKNLSKSIALLRKAKDFTSQEELVTIYNSLVLPHSNYCSTIWNDNDKSHIDKLLKLQKRAARVITSSDYTIKSSQVFETLQWHSINNLMDKRDLTMIFKVVKNIAPNYLTNMFRKCDNFNYSLN